jgi:hypothetical protein
MRNRWSSLRKQLDATLSTRTAHRRFLEWRQREACLDHFGGPLGVSQFLLDRSIDAGLKSIVAAALVRAGRVVHDRDTGPMAILLVGLAPAMEAIHARAARRWRRDPDELASIVSEQFCLAVSSIDLKVVRCVVSTLVFNTERRVRDIVDSLVEEDRRREKPILEPSDSDAEPPDAFGASDEGRSVEVADALLDACRALGTGKAKALLHGILAGHSREELAATLGISPIAVARRVDRAVRRLAA